MQKKKFSILQQIQEIKQQCETKIKILKSLKKTVLKFSKY